MPSLYESMQARMKAVQGGQADPGNPDLYGSNQTTGAPVSNNPTAGISAGGPDPYLPGGATKPAQTVQDVTKNTATVGATTAQGQPTTVAQSFQQALVNRLNPTAVSAQSASVAPAIEANKLAEQRGTERQRAMLAEQQAAQGINNSGGADSRFLGLEQDRAAREGQFAGNAVQRANDIQSRDMTSALGMAGGLLSGNANLAQQKELADLDAQLRREGYGLQGELGRGDLSLRGELGRGQLNAQLLGLLLNNQLGQGQLALGGAQLDQNGLLGLLGGL